MGTLRDEFSHGDFDPSAILAEFEPYGRASQAAKAAAETMSLLHGAFDALARRLAPILSITEAMSGFGIDVPLGSLLSESPEMREVLDGVRRADSDIQTLSSKGLASALVAAEKALQQDGADGDTSARLVSSLREACLASLPERCRKPWGDYLHKVEVACAAIGDSEPPKGSTPRL